MKTTMDLPVELIREMKLRAVQEGRKLREVAEEVIRRGLEAPMRPPPGRSRRRVVLPILPAPEGAVPFEFSGDRLLELEQAAEQEASS